MQVSSTCRLLCGAAKEVLDSCTSLQVVDWKKEPRFWDTDLLLDWAPSIVNLHVKGAHQRVCFDYFLKAATSLETLSVDFEVGYDDIELGWLTAGTHKRLSLSLVLASDLPEDHELVVEQLLDVSISELTLYMGNDITADAQEVWEKLHVKDSLLVELWELNKFVYALPSCPVIKIYAQEERSERHAPLDVRWKAINRHAGSVEIDCSLTLGLEVSGSHPNESPGPDVDDIKEPWRLRVNDAIFTWGLPRSEPCPNAYFLRNAAAVAAGWDDGAEPGRECQVPSEYQRYLAIEYMHEG